MSTENQDKSEQLPDLHRQAFLIKNRKRLQHDGGRAWIKDGQLHEAVKGVNVYITRGKSREEMLRGSGREVIERKKGELISKTNSLRKL